MAISLTAKADIGSMEIEHYCAFNDIKLPKRVTTFSSDQEAKEALRRVMQHTGLAASFEILAYDVPNAAAVIHEGKRYILYNQKFMRNVRDMTKDNWGEISILAHEIGHHLNAHTLDNRGSRPAIELEADRFSGFVLNKMGASLNQASAAMEKLVSPQGSSTHPGRDARVAAITNGWIAAEEVVERGSVNVLSIDHNGGNDGAYFNFKISSLDSVLGTTGWDNKTFRVKQPRTGKIANAIFWRRANGGSIGDGHGRWDDGTASYTNIQWRVGDKIVIYE